MFFKTASVVALAATAALAQSEITQEIAQAITQFEAQGITPTVLEKDDFNLTSALVLSFNGQNATIGQAYTLPADTEKLANAPTYQLDVPAMYSAQYQSEEFTAMLVDPGAAGQILGESKVTRHYLANGLKLSEGKLMNSTPAITSYNAPGPAAGSGVHRYLALVFAQGSDFKAPSDLSNPGTPLANMTLSDYIDQSDIGKIVAASYIAVENNQQGSQTFSSTSAVPSATLEAVASSVSQSLNGSPSATSTGSGSGSSGAMSTGLSTGGVATVALMAGTALIGSMLL
ncbi:unnamed protein product [Sympodiomycopsis kandeliae]